MQHINIENKYIIRLEKDEEILEQIKKVCSENYINAGTIKGIGAVKNVKIGFFDVNSKEYHAKIFEDNFEIVSLMGNISTLDNEPYIHVHAALGDKDFKVIGGHLNEAYVSATCEITIEQIEGYLDREFDEEIGLNLFKI